MARDIGRALGSGAHLVSLVRTRVGDVHLKDCYTVDQIDGIIEKARLEMLAEEEKENYHLLTKLGIPQRRIRRMIFEQNALTFFPPMILGITHAVFAINVFTQYIKTADYWLAYLVSGLLILIYLLLYVITSQLYCRIIEE